LNLAIALHARMLDYQMTKNEQLNIIFSDLSKELDNADEDIPLYENQIIDSFDVLRLVTEIELVFDIKIDITDLLKNNFSKLSLRLLIE